MTTLASRSTRIALAVAAFGATLASFSPVAQAEPGCLVTNPPVVNRCVTDPATEPPDAPPPGRPVRVAMCQDGAFAFTQHTYYEGTCYKHGGVAQWLPDNTPPPPDAIPEG